MIDEVEVPTDKLKELDEVGLADTILVELTEVVEVITIGYCDSHALRVESKSSGILKSPKLQTEVEEVELVVVVFELLELELELELLELLELVDEEEVWLGLESWLLLVGSSVILFSGVTDAGFGPVLGPVTSGGGTTGGGGGGRGGGGGGGGTGTTGGGTEGATGAGGPGIPGRRGMPGRPGISGNPGNFGGIGAPMDMTVGISGMTGEIVVQIGLPKPQVNTVTTGCPSQI